MAQLFKGQIVPEFKTDMLDLCKCVPGLTPHLCLEM